MLREEHLVSRRTWEWLILALILIPFMLVHLFFAVDRDSGAFLTIAQGLLDGRLPYRDFFDHKPPGIYYTLAIPLALSRGSIWAAKGFLLMISACTLWLIAQVLGALEADGRTIWWGVAFGALGWVVYQGYTLVTETLVALVVTGTLSLIISERPKVFGLAGFLIGVAVLFKQPAVLFLLPMLVHSILNRSIQAFWETTAGFTVALLIGGLLLLASGNGISAYEQIILANLRTPLTGDLRETIKGNFQRFLEGAPLWTAAGLSLISQFRNRKILFLVAALLMAWFPALLHPTPHYLIPAVPIGAILAALGIRRVEQHLPDQLAAAPILLTLFPLWVNLLFPTLAAFSHMTLLQQIQVGRVLESLSNPDEPILVLAAEPQYYFFAHRYPPGRDLYLLAVNYTEDKEAQMIDYLKSGQVSIVAIVGTPPTSFYAPQIRTYVETHCTIIASFPSPEINIWGNCR